MGVWKTLYCKSVNILTWIPVETFVMDDQELWVPSLKQTIKKVPRATFITVCISTFPIEWTPLWNPIGFPENIFETLIIMLHQESLYLIQNSPAVKKVCGHKKAIVKKDVKSKVAAKKWPWW